MGSPEGRAGQGRGGEGRAGLGWAGLGGPKSTALASREQWGLGRGTPSSGLGLSDTGPLQRLQSGPSLRPDSDVFWPCDLHKHPKTGTASSDALPWI